MTLCSNIIKSLVLIFCLTSCLLKEDTKQDTVKIRVDHFPQSLNYLINGSYLAHDIQRKTFNELLVHNEKADLKPLVAISLPKVTEIDSGYLFKYEIRKEAKWDNGNPITSRDIEFSLKAYKLPLKENVEISSYYSRIKDVICNEKNNKIFDLFVKGNKNDLFRLTGDFGILEKAKFDPKGLLDSIRLSDFDFIPKEIVKNEKVISFYKAFTEDRYKYNNQFFSSSGSYQISTLEHGKSITLIKNENWWGNTLTDSIDYLHAMPPTITYHSIPETLTALYALRNGDIDVMDNIPSNEFTQLENNVEFKKKFNLFTPLKYTFTYVGFNTENQHLSDKKLRQALAVLIDKTKIVASVESGYAQPTVGPINPTKEFYYNNEIIPTKYDPSNCVELLTKAGLKKVNGKWYQGEGKPLEFTLIHKQNSVYESIAQIFASEAQKIGIKISTVSYDDRTVRKMVKDRNFDITIGSFNGSPFSYNFSGLFSTGAARAGGMNFTGFGNEKSDSIIQAINYAEDSIQRRNRLFEFQKMLHEETTMVFLYFVKNKIAINKKFTNLNISSLKPGYDVTSFKLIK